MKIKKHHYSVIEAQNAAWKVLSDAMLWHDDLDAARIGLAWKKRQKPDKDGHLELAKCVKVSDLYGEFTRLDFIIVFNREAWDDLTESQRLALMDHELCHASPEVDPETSEQVVNEKLRPAWRVRKHDIEEFDEVVRRHGPYKQDLLRFSRAIQQHPLPLFDKDETSKAVINHVN